MKKNKIISTIIILLFTTISMVGQQTVYNSTININLREANSLFAQHNYGAALSAFKAYMEEETDKKSSAYEDACYFSTICNVKIGNKNAKNELLKFASDYPASAWVPTVNFELGNIYYKDKKYSKALESFQMIVPSKLSNNQQLEYYYKKGYCLMKQSKFDEALSSYQNVMGTESNYSVPASYYYAHLQYQKGNINEALVAFKKIENERKFKKYVPLYLIKIYYQQGDYQTVIDEGVVYLPKVAKQEKSNIARLIANSYYELNDFAKANEYFTKYESSGRRKNDPEEQYRIGYSKFVVEKYKGAINNFQAATKAGGTVEQNAWYYLGYCYLYSDQTKFAQNAFLKAYKQNTNKDIAADALFSYIKITINQGIDSYNNPVSIVEEFINNNPNSEHTATAYELLSQLYLSSKNYNAALKSIEKTKHPNKQLKSVYQKLAYEQGITFLKQRAYTDAITSFNSSLKFPIDKKLQSQAIYWKADALYRQKKFKKAASGFYNFRISKAAKQTNLYANSLYNSAYCYFNLGQYANATNLFQQFLQQNASANLKDDAYLRLADSYLITKDYNKAIKWYDKVIISGSKNSDYALYQKAICYGSQGNFNKKIETLNTLSSYYKKSQYYDDALYDLASTHLIINDQRHAISNFNKLVKENPKSSYAKKALVKMGFIYYGNNQYNQSIEALKRVINNYPASLEAKEALVTLQNVYMDMGKINDYIAYTNTLDFIQVSTSEEDSLKFTTGENYYIDNDCKNATAALTNYVNEFPSGGFVITAYHYLSQCAEKSGNTKKAITYYKKIISFPENQYTTKALLKVARQSFQDKDYEQSLVYYEKLSQISDNKLMVLEATDGIMKSAWNTGNKAKVKEAAKKLLMTDKVSEDQIIYSHYLLAMIAMEEKKNAEAKKEFEITTKLSSGAIGAEALYYEALIVYRQNKLEDAEKLIYELPDKYGNFDYWIAKGFILLADIYVARDNIFQAKSTLQSVIENYKGDGDLVQVAQGKLERLSAFEKEQNNKEGAKDEK